MTIRSVPIHLTALWTIVRSAKRNTFRSTMRRTRSKTICFPLMTTTRSGAEA